MHIKSLNVKTIATVGVMAATLECGKLVLSFLPNIEVVSILTALYGFVFGWAGVLASFIFVMIEPLIWGFGPWFITYLIYWPLLAFVFMCLGRRKIENRWLILAIILGLTVGFGVLSSIIDVALYIGVNKHYLSNLALYYIRGIGFYLTQICCNAVLFLLIFKPLKDRLTRIKGCLMIE